MAAQNKPIHISLPKNEQDVVIPVHAGDKLTLEFAIEEAAVRKDGNDLILECSDGSCLLRGALSNGADDVEIQLADGQQLSLVDFLARYGEQPTATGPEANLHADASLPAGQAEEDGNDGASSLPSSGIELYNDHSGALVGSVDRLGTTGADFWQGGTSHAAGREALVPHAGVPVPTIDLALRDGRYYPASHIVMESDPDGIMLHMKLSTPASSLDTVLLDFGGSAQMGVDYQDISHWSLQLADGTVLTGAHAFSANGNSLTLMLPPGAQDFTLRIPLIDNELTNPDRTFVYTVRGTGGYSLHSGQTGMVLIVDDSRVQDLVPGWTPPDPGTLPPDAVSPSGPLLRLSVLDHGVEAGHLAVMENDPTPITYRLSLEDLRHGGGYQPLEDIHITVRVSGANGFALNGADADFTLFDFSDFTAKGILAHTYDPTTGLLTFTLPAGWTYGHVDFTGAPIADTRMEGLLGVETVRMEIVSVVGNEAVHQSDPVLTDVVDVPTVFVNLDTTLIFESAGHPTLPNTADFTFGLTSAVPHATTVQLDWSKLAGLTDSDLTVMINGLPVAGLPSSITFPAGQTSLTVTVTAVDDALSEGLEKLAVAILPEHGSGSAAVGDNYHVADGSGGRNGSAELSIQDDTSFGVHDPSHQGGHLNPYIDGPSVQVIAVRGFPGPSQILYKDADGQPVTEFGVLENFNTAQYKVALLNPDGSLYRAQEDIQVSFEIKGFGGITLIQGPTPEADPLQGPLPNGYLPYGTPNTWDLFANNMQAMGFTWHGDNDGNGYWTGTIPAGKTGLDFHFLVHPDTTENEDGEGFTIAVLSVSGNEATIGHDIVNTMYDSPVISITGDAAYVSESDVSGPSFTLHTSAPAAVDLLVRVSLGAAGDTATFDADYSRDGLVEVSGKANYIWVTIPAGADKVTFRVPLKDDALTEGNETFTISVQPEHDGGPATDKYRVSPDADKANAGVTIVDDTKPWPADALPTNPAPVGHGVLEGPEVRLVLTDEHGVPLSDTAACQVMENGGPVYYTLQLVDKGTDNPYSGPDVQDVQVTLSAVGRDGAMLSGPGKDMDFANGTGGMGGNGWSYNPGTGAITVTIPAGVGQITFTGTPVGDGRIEGAGLGGSAPQEKVDVSISAVSGHEAVIDTAHDGVSTEIIDVPTVSVATNVAEIFESAGHATLPNTATYTFTLSSASLEPVTVHLDWGTGSTASNADYTASTSAGGTSLPGTITFTPGQTTYTVTVTAVDDKLSELAETLKVTLRPADWDGTIGTDHAGDSYHVTGGAGGSAGVTIRDDTADAATWLDGPVLMLVHCDAAGNILPGNGLANTHVWESSTTPVYYKAALFAVDASGNLLTDGSGNYIPYQADQDVTVSVRVQGSANTTLFTGLGTDFTFDGTTAYSKIGNIGFNGAGWTPGLDTGTLSLTIQAGTTGTVFHGNTVPDLNLENTALAPEFVNLSIASASGNEVRESGNSLHTEIMDTPQISLTAGAASYSEHGSAMEFTLHLTAPAAADLTVQLGWSGTATAGTDFTNTTFVVIPAGQTTFTFTAPITDDALTEGTETAILSILPADRTGLHLTDPYYVAGSGNNATVSILDDALTADRDGPQVRLVMGDGSSAADIMENGGTATYRLELVNADGTPYTGQREAVTVTLLADGSAGTLLTGLTDYTFTNGTGGTGWSYTPATGVITVIIPVGVNSITFNGTSLSDSRAEAVNDGMGGFVQEGVSLVVDTVGGNESSIHITSSTTVTIIDVPTASVAASLKYYSETGPDAATPSVMEFVVTLTSPVPHDTVISLVWSGTASSADYTGSLPTTVTILAGQTSAHILVPIVDDRLSESNETVSVALQPQNGSAQAGNDFHIDAGKSNATATIVDDTQPWPSNPPAGNEAPAWHGAGDTALLNRLDGPLIVISAGAGNENVAGGSRYTQHHADNDIRYDADARNPIALEGVNSEGRITYNVDLVNRVGGAAWNAQEAVTIELKITPENGATYGDALAGGDFHLDMVKLLADYPGATFNAATGILTLTVPAGGSHLSFDILTVPDTNTEVGRKEYDEHGAFVGNIPDEAFTISVHSATGNEAFADPVNGHITTTIDEDHLGIQVGIVAINATDVKEGNDAWFQVQLTAAAAEDVQVILEPLDAFGNWHDGSDFANATLNVTIPKGSTTVNIPIAIFNDTFGEGREGFIIRIKDVIGGEASINPSRQQATGTMIDDMNGPVCSIGAGPGNNGSYGESDGTAAFTVQLSDPAGFIGNGIPSEPMTVYLKLSGVAVGADLPATITGAGADVQWDPSTIAFSDPRITIDTTKSDLANGVIAIKVPAGYGNNDGTNGAFSFTVKIVDDAQTEGKEHFGVTISKVEGSEATVNDGAKSVVTAIIDDDAIAAGDPGNADTVLDGPYVHLTGTDFISESGGNATYTITLTDPDGHPYTALQDIVVTIGYSAKAGDGYDGAEPGKDFEVLPHNTTITIPAGSSSGSFTVRIADDQLSENNERFAVTITKVSGNEARIPTDPAEVTVNTIIVDDTQPLPGGVPVPPGGHTLDGPILTLSGGTWVYENVGNIGYNLNLDRAPAEDISVTMKLVPQNGLTLDDLLGPPVAGQYNYSGLSGLGITNFTPVNQAAFDAFVANPALGYTAGWTFTVTVREGYSISTVRIPVYNDDFTESGEGFTLSIADLSGSEARIGGAGSVTTSIVDDNGGPTISIRALDPDGDGLGHADWQPNATVLNTDDADYVQFKVETTRAAAEDITVRVYLLNSDAGRGDRGAPLEDASVAKLVGTGSGAYYEVVIKAGTTETVFSLPKSMSGGDYAGDYYIMQAAGASGSESFVGGNTYATMDITPPAGEGPSTYITLSNITPNDGHTANNGIPSENGEPFTQYIQEGKDATLHLAIGGTGNLDGGGDTTVAHTVTMLLVNKYWFDYGNSVAPYTGSDIDFSQFGTGDYADLTWNPTTHTITVTIPAGIHAADGFDFKLPMTADARQENTDSFSLIPVNGGDYAGVSTTPVDLAILDVFDGPVISLHQATDSVTEGNSHEYYVEVDKECGNNFTIYLNVADGDGNSAHASASANKDYIPVSSVTLTSGGWVQVGAVWRQYFSIKTTDDQYTEPDEYFTVKMTGTSDSRIGIDNTQDTVATHIVDDGLSGPKVSFAKATDAFDEDADHMAFDIVLERPAVENVTVTVEIKDALVNGTTFGADYILQGTNPAGAGYVPGYRFEGGKHLIDVVIPKGDVQVKLNLDKVLTNDTLTELNEHFGLTLIKVTGGEAQIDGAKSAMDITVHDVLNGPLVTVAADKTQVYENAGTLDGSATSDPNGIVTYTFSIPGGEPALQRIQVTFVVEAVTGLSGGVPMGTHTVWIEVGDTSATWTMNTLINDKQDERSPQDVYRVRITDVSGNEARVGGASSVTTSIVDDDHAPVTQPEKVVMLVAPSPAGGSLALNVLRNDSDADGDPIRTEAGTKAAAYGIYIIGNNGELVYTLDGSKIAVDRLANGETLMEDNFTYTVYDTDAGGVVAYNKVTGTAGLEIKAQSSYTGSSGVEWIFGTGQNESIKGGGGADILHGGAGNDTLYDHGDGKAILYGDEDNDSFIVAKTPAVVTADSLSEIHGGTGVDAIKLESAGQTLRFTAEAWAKTDITGPDPRTGAPWTRSPIDGIEVLDITGTGNNRIELDSFAVHRLSQGMDDLTTPLRITGDFGDTFAFPKATEGWHSTGAQTLGPETYTIFTDNSGNIVWVNNLLAWAQEYGATDDTRDSRTFSDQGTGNFALSGGGGNDNLTGGAGNDLLFGGDGNDTLDGGAGRNLLDGGAGNDLLVVHDTTGDGYVTKADFVGLFGGDGVDTLKLAGDNTPGGVILDFTRIDAGMITGIENIALHGSPGSPGGILLSDAALTKLSESLSGQAQLRITGNAGDTFELSGASFGTPGSWTYLGPVTDNGDWYSYRNGDGKIVYIQNDLTRVITGTDGTDAIGGGSEASVVIRAGGGNDMVNGGSGNETIYGGDGNDTLHGGGGTNVLYGGAGNDVLYADGAADTLHGEAGNDVLVLRDNTGDGKVTGADVAGIDGGAGTDTLRIDGAGLAIDLRTFAPGQLDHIETINISGSGNNHIVLDATTLTALSAGLDGQAQLRITGNAGDTFELPGYWAYGGTAPGGWYTYLSENNDVIWVQNTLQRVYTGGTGNETFVVDDLSGDAKITGLDFAVITGGGGNDTLALERGGLTVDFSALPVGKVNGIGTLDLGTPPLGTPNHAVLADGTLTAFAGDLHLTGAAGNTFTLLGSWTHLDEVGGHRYQDSAGRILTVDAALLPVYVGTAGNDTLTLYDLTGDGTVDAADFVRISGGGGLDTLALGAGAGKLDLSGLGAGTVGGISAVTLSGNGNGNLTLDAGSLTAMNCPTLTVRGDAGDTFTLQGNWTYNGHSGGFYTYTDASGKTVKAQDTMLRAFAGADGVGDTFTLHDVSGDGTVNGADFASIFGGTGTDMLKLATAGLTLDLTGTTAAKISGIEIVDLTTSAGSRVLFDAGTLDNMGATTLLVEGNTGNAFELRGSGWSYTGPAGAYYTYSDASGNILEISQALKRVYTGTNGADSFEVNDTNSDGRISADDFASINGGLGLDSLVVGGQNLIFDLSHLGAGVISGIERIDLGTGGTNRLVLDQTSLTNMGIAVSQALTVDGNAGDTFDLKGTWTFLGTSGGYSRYKDAGNHEVLIENALKRVYDGTTGTNALVLDDVNGNGVVSWEDFSAVHGNGVTSTLGVAGNGTTLDLCGLPALDTVIHGVKIIDLGGNGNNTVILDADTHTGMGLLPADVLLINGEAGDSFDLRGSWTYSGMTAGRHIFVDAGFRTISIAPELVRAYTGDAGNNSFALADLSGDGTIDKADFARINGGGGSDTLTFDAGTAAGTTLDLTGLTAGTVQGIGTVDISGHGNNHVLIDAGTLVGQSNPLTLTGNAGDTYELVGAGWNYTGAASGFHTYSNGTHTLSVADDLTRVLHAPDAGVGIENTRITDILYGGTGADTFALNDLNGDGMVDKADFGRIAGGGGSDVLTFAAGTTAGTTLDLTGLAAGTIQGIDTVDVAGFGDNHVLIDAGTLAGQSNPLTLTGNAGDTYELMGAGWSYTGTALGFHTYSDGAHILRVADDLTRVLHAPDSGVGLENTLATDILHGGAGVDTFSMADLSADGKITGADFGELHGAGMDVLHVAGAGLTLDLTDLGAGKISGIEHIDLGAAGNTLSLDQGTFTDLNVTDLHITGGGADQVDLTGNWSWDDLAGGYTLGGRQVILDNPVGVVIHADATGEIFAGPGDVAVYCGTGDDTIHGNTGNDTIHAGTGTNTLYGGDGQDLFIWDTAAMNGSLDTIMDFALGEDRMGFVELFADSGVPDSSAVHDVLQQHRIEVEATDANNLTVTVGPQTVAVHLSGAGFVDYAAIYDTNPVVAEEAKAALLEQMLRGVTG